jgi:hypothetical protein
MGSHLSTKYCDMSTPYTLDLFPETPSPCFLILMVIFYLRDDKHKCFHISHHPTQHTGLISKPLLEVTQPYESNWFVSLITKSKCQTLIHIRSKIDSKLVVGKPTCPTPNYRNKWPSHML